MAIDYFGTALALFCLSIITIEVNKMNKSNNFYKDITVGLFFISGVLGFMSGEFIVSTALFGAASLLSNIHFAEQVQA